MFFAVPSVFIESLKKYDCPLKSNHLVDDAIGVHPYQYIRDLNWSDVELNTGKTSKINAFPKQHKVTLFRVVVSSHRTDYVVTHDLTQDSTKNTQKAYALRWKIEQFHRKIKQTTGIESCLCRFARMQRNHIACAILGSIEQHRIQFKTDYLSGKA